MRKKRLVTIILSVVLFLAIGVLGIANVYRVDSVSIEASTISSQAEEEATRLQQDLNIEYVGKNTLFVDQNAANDVVKKYPYFRIVSFRKEFPNHIVIEVKEDEEMFAVANEEGYSILGKDGVYLGESDTRENRSGNYENILVKGIQFNGTLGKVVSGTAQVNGFVSAVRAMTAVEGMGGSLRGNVLEIELMQQASDFNMLRIKMKEGIVIYIFNVDKQAAEKATRVTEEYLELPDAKKLSGAIVINDSLVVSTRMEDDFYN